MFEVYGNNQDIGVFELQPVPLASLQNNEGTLENKQPAVINERVGSPRSEQRGTPAWHVLTGMGTGAL